MSKTIKPLLQRVLDTEGMDARIAAFKAKLDTFNKASPSTKDDGKEHDNLTAYLASAGPTPRSWSSSARP